MRKIMRHVALALALALWIGVAHTPPVSAATNGIYASNRLHASLMRMPKAQKAATMRYLIRLSGNVCSLVQMQKFDRFNEVRTAIHVVVCAEGTYVVVIKTDDKGTTDVRKIRV